MSDALTQSRGFEHLLKKSRYPHTWCPGCGIGLIFHNMALALAQMGYDHTNTVAVSGIGCSGRMAGYLDLDSVHTPHGRALPVAEAIKLVNPALNVVVASGDGDLASIGGNHLIHTSRRNPDIAVFCVNNETYGLTGGQLAPTTPKGVTTITSLTGALHNPLSMQKIVTGNLQYFYARSTVYHLDHMLDCMRKAIEWPGFAFVEIISDCIELYGRRLGFKTAHEMIATYRDKYTLAPAGAAELGPNEIGIMAKA